MLYLVWDIIYTQDEEHLEVPAEASGAVRARMLDNLVEEVAGDVAALGAVRVEVPAALVSGDRLQSPLAASAPLEGDVNRPSA